ncbi:abc transporter-like protein 17 [Dermatophagoides farinae]|uniref:Abc transporter-like protein 17 n=1 Tax=Dermatophagoides farinae TaxID=6954 RepID=A0A9D4SJT2_DERFA|nr:abc transporter-like protein 17 [Dermatophagoides farinae]
MSCDYNTLNISIAWRNLSYEVKDLFRNRKLILRQLNGHLNYQSLNGFLGPSGAGKTTLLNCLNGTLRSGITLDSEIYLNRKEQQTPVIRMIEQHVHETILGQLTIRQVLYYAFRFKNGRENLYQIDQHINKVINELLLDKNILDNKFEQCSGGEQKRVGIAQELMSLQQPSFLFIDEPTTGLDSNSALLVMQCLRRLVDHNDRLTILVSIHAPNSEMLNLFDKLYILSKNGVCIYSDEPKNLSISLETNCNSELSEEKPAIEEYLKVACHEFENELVRKLADTVVHDEQIRAPISQINGQLRFLDRGIQRNRKAFSMGDLFLQLYRMFDILLIIEYRKLIIQIILLALLSVILKSAFNPQMVTPETCMPINVYDNESYTKCVDKLNDEDYNAQYKAFMGHCTLDFALILIIVNIISFMKIFKVFCNEHRNQWYSLGTFYISFSIVHFIELCFISSYIVVLLYFLIDHSYVDGHQMNWLRLGNMIYFRWMYDLYLQSLALLVCLIFSNYLEIAIVAGGFIVQTIHLLSGSLYNLEQMQNPTLKLLANIINSKVPVNGWLYSFYVLDRCDLEKEISYIMVDYGIDTNTIYSDVIKIFINIGIIRIVTVVLMFFRFSADLSTKKFSQSKNDQLKLINFDAEIDTNSEYVNSIDTKLEIEITRNKEDKELDFEKFTRGKIMIAWRSVTLFATTSIYEIRSVKDIKPDSKLILRNLNGQFRFGTLNALMGPSGAGKTSLLKVLNGQMKTRLSQESEFFLTKYCPTRVCYLTQEVSGHLMPGLTALQSLIYASRLKNAFEESSINHESIARNLLNELCMADSADNYVHKCSGGERKRLALGLELTSLRMPNLICIDEPTSGLDSNSAEVVIACLHRLAQLHNLTIIASVHQPNVKVLMMFDQLYVLAKGGVCVYSEKPTNIRKYLSRISTNGMMKNDIFPVEKLIKYSCLDHSNSFVQKLVNNANEIILKENPNEDTIFVMDGIPTNRNYFSLRHSFILICRYLNYFKGYQWIPFTILSILLIYQAKNLGSMFNAKIAQSSGCVDWDDDYNNTCTNEERNKELLDLKLNFVRNYAILFSVTLLLLIQTSFFFYYDIRFFWNEHRNGWYSAGVFYLTRIMIEWIQILVVSAIFDYIIDIYEPIKSGMYFWQWFFHFMAIISIQGAGYLVATMTNDDPITMAILLVGIGISNALLSNGGTPIRQLHYFYQFLSNFSPLRFAIEAIMVRLYGFGRCFPRQTPAILYKLRIDNDEYFYHCIIMIIINVLLYHSLAFIAIIIKSNPFDRRRRRAEKILEHHEKLEQINVAIPGLGCHHEFIIKRIEI